MASSGEGSSARPVSSQARASSVDRAADAAVLLGEGEPGQPELLGERPPQRRVVSGGGADGGPDLVGAAAFAQQLAQGAADLVLLRGEARRPSSGSSLI